MIGVSNPSLSKHGQHVVTINQPQPLIQHPQPSLQSRAGSKFEEYCTFPIYENYDKEAYSNDLYIRETDPNSQAAGFLTGNSLNYAREDFEDYADGLARVGEAYLMNNNVDVFAVDDEGYDDNYNWFKYRDEPISPTLQPAPPVDPSSLRPPSPPPLWYNPDRYQQQPQHEANDSDDDDDSDDDEELYDDEWARSVMEYAFEERYSGNRWSGNEIFIKYRRRYDGKVAKWDNLDENERMRRLHVWLAHRERVMKIKRMNREIKLLEKILLMARTQQHAAVAYSDWVQHKDCTRSSRLQQEKLLRKEHALEERARHIAWERRKATGIHYETWLNEREKQLQQARIDAENAKVQHRLAVEREKAERARNVELAILKWRQRDEQRELSKQNESKNTKVLDRVKKTARSVAAEQIFEQWRSEKLAKSTKIVLQSKEIEARKRQEQAAIKASRQKESDSKYVAWLRGKRELESKQRNALKDVADDLRRVERVKQRSGMLSYSTTKPIGRANTMTAISASSKDRDGCVKGGADWRMKTVSTPNNHSQYRPINQKTLHSVEVNRQGVAISDRERQTQVEALLRRLRLNQVEEEDGMKQELTHHETLRKQTQRFTRKGV